jgi:hypothetical protein
MGRHPKPFTRSDFYRGSSCSKCARYRWNTYGACRNSRHCEEEVAISARSAVCSSMRPGFRRANTSAVSRAATSLSNTIGLHADTRGVVGERPNLNPKMAISPLRSVSAGK